MLRGYGAFKATHTRLVQQVYVALVSEWDSHYMKRGGTSEVGQAWARNSIISSQQSLCSLAFTE